MRITKHNIVDSIQDKDTAVIVRSPFQALCAIEAIKEFRINKYSFYIYGNDKTARMTTSYVESLGYICQSVEEGNNTIDIIIKQRKHKKYEALIIGDYYSYIEFLIASLWSKRDAVIIYVDDGNSTLELLPPTNRRRRTGWGFTLRTVCDVAFCGLIGIKNVKEFFFSIFNIEGYIPYEVVHNDFKSLSINENERLKQGIYIIGTNTTALKWDTEQYLEKLKNIHAVLVKRYPDQRIYYCPHRNDRNDNDYICKTAGFELFNTDVSVEVDFVNRNIYPMVIIGFGSTALLTVKMIFKDVKTVSIEFAGNDPMQKVYKPIEELYAMHGVNVSSLKDLNKLL